MLKTIMGSKWGKILDDELKSEWFNEILKKLEKEEKNYNIFPDKESIFRAFTLTDFDDVKVVILGQDPYHTKGMAEGLAFSVREGKNKLPPSLKNIMKEYFSDMGKDMESSSLVNWAENGVLLLNTSLTVREGEANSHKNLGWKKFISCVIMKLLKEKRDIVFILWGKDSIDLADSLGVSEKNSIRSSHPSPLSAYKTIGKYPAFLGSKPFSKANEKLNVNIF